MSNNDNERLTRREWFKLLGTGTAIGLAGCLGNQGSGGTTTQGSGGTTTQGSGGTTTQGSGGTTTQGSGGTTTQGSGGSDVSSISLLTWNISFIKDSIKNGWIKDFHESGPPVEQGHPNTKVNWSDKKGTKMSTYYQTQLQSNSPVTVFDTQSAVYSKFASAGVFADLQNYATDKFLKPLDKRALDFSKINGKLYRIPYYQNSSSTYIRKKWFDQAGIDKYPKSTKEFFDTAEKLVNKSDAKYGMVFVTFNYRIMPFFWAEGIDVLNSDQSKAAFNTDRAVEIVKRLQDLTDKGVIPDVTWTGQVEPQSKQFGTGNTGMFVTPLSSIRRVQSYGDWINSDSFDLSVAPGNKGTYQAHGLSITSSNVSKAKQKVAWDLIRVILSAKWQKDFLKKTTVIGVNKNIQDKLSSKESFQQNNPLKVKAYNIWPKLSKGAVVPPTIAGSSQIADILDSQISSAALGQKDPKQALDTAERKANNAIKNQ